MDTKSWAAAQLAARLLSRPWTRAEIAAGVDEMLGFLHPRTRAALIVRLAAWSETAYPPSPHRLVSYLLGSRFFRSNLPENVSARVAPVLASPILAPVAALRDLPIPALATLGALSEWLYLPPEQLDWLADQRRGHGRAKTSALQHYRYAFVSRPGRPPRLIEAPKPRLKAIQRRILRDILDIVPVHRAACGFVAGRSCLNGAQVHAGEAMVATFDLAQFFPSIGLARVHGIFRSLGYPWAVARRLAGLCTTITPAQIFRQAPEEPEWQIQALYRSPHLPQGAPTSPALANLLAWRLDLRLTGLANALDARYSRYADDLAFSGPIAGSIGRLGKAVRAIAADEGFTLNAGKTRIMPASTRQRVTGIVVNAYCNIGRAEFDVLKAMLHNCVRFGPTAQNRAQVPDFRRHLDGRVTWAEQVNPARGSKLRRLFDRIDWSNTNGP